MEENKSKPFLCLDVSDQSTLCSITNRIDELFPNTLVRLKINGSFSPFFYAGKGRWLYKPKPKKILSNKSFNFKIFLDDSAIDFLEKDQILMLEHLGLNVNNLKSVGEISIAGKDFPGLFFTDGNNVVVDQSLVDSSNLLVGLIALQLESKIVLDLSNKSNSGIIVLKTQKRIFGEEYDQDN